MYCCVAVVRGESAGCLVCVCVEYIYNAVGFLVVLVEVVVVDQSASYYLHKSII